jgi:RNA polymerase-binding transcription factor DksA
MAPPSAEDLLSAEKLITIARIRALSAEFEDMVAGQFGANSDDEHDPEGSTIAFERSRVSMLLSQERARLAEIELAQHRAATGAYGVCEACGSAIPGERLQALPTARRCVHCC